MVKDLKDRLKVQVAEIPDHGLEISEELPREWLDNIPEFSDDSGTHIQGPVKVSGRLRKEGDNLRLNGRVSASLATFCTRCGDDMKHDLASEFELTLIRGRASAPEKEMELAPEDLDTSYYNGVQVDLAPFFQEEVAVQAPMQPLCKPDCKGLCTRCGTNLNNERCGCEKEEGDPRLAVLRNLKIKK
jgi:uncharacterized protein